MNINKAIKKQKKSYKRFMLTMSFIFFILPAVLIIFKRYNMFYLVYLGIIEFLIILAVIARINRESLNFYSDNYRIKVISGIKRDILTASCNKVAFVHTENVIRRTDKEKDFIIILLFSKEIRGKRIFKINKKFLNDYPYIAFHYYRLKRINPENRYSFAIISKGKLYKYELLDMIYRNCVNAFFTEDAVDKIKEFRDDIM